MALVTKVKAGNITNLSDARYCAGMGVDWIGFPAAEVDEKKFQEITGWLSGPMWVIELGHQPWPALDYPVQIWQCTLADLEQALHLKGSLIVQLDIAQWKKAEPILRANKNRIEAIVLQSFLGDAKSDKQMVETIQTLFPVLVDMNSSYPLTEVLSWSPMGIQLYGSSEERPGLKDYTQLADILEQLEAD